MIVLEQFLKSKLQKISVYQKACFLSVFAAGILSHGYMFLNKISYQDDIWQINGLGATFTLGRWFLGILYMIGQKLYGGTYSAPFFLGILSLVFISITAMLCVDILKIKSILSAIFTGVILVVFPSVTSIFAYMFTSAAYFMGGTFAVLAVYLPAKKIRVWRVAVSVLLVSAGLGIYQSFFSFAATLSILLLITELLEGMDVKDIIRKGCMYLFILSAGMILYLCLNKLMLKVVGESLSSYKGMDKIGTIDFAKIPSMIKSAYYNLLFDLNWTGVNNLLSMKLIVAILIVLVGVLVVKILFGNMITKGAKVIMLALLLCLPIAINIVYLMSSAPGYWVHTIMRYSSCLSFLLPIVLLERLNEYDIKKSMVSCMVCCLMSILLWCISLHYIYNNNAAYLKISFLQEETIAYYTVLIGEIRGTDGYTDELPVAYVGGGNIKDLTLTEDYFDEITIVGYGFNLDSMINNTYAMRAYMSMHLGFSPNIVEDTEELRADEEVKAMPCYPDDGSIKVVDGILVVKFSD